MSQGQHKNEKFVIGHCFRTNHHNDAIFMPFQNGTKL
jgi:hypothetical protein